MEKTTVVGGGSWGTALAMLLAGEGVPTVIWAREAEVVESISTERENRVFLPGVRLPESLSATGDLDHALSGAGVVVSAVPTQFIRQVFGRLDPAATTGKLLVTVSKGIEVESLLTPSEVFAEVHPGDAADGIVCLSGPSFAREVAAAHPTAVVAAGAVEENVLRVRDVFSTDSFRVYSSDDIRSVELGAALKNVMAIAAGMVEGLRLGHNTVAAVITRGLAEITRLGVARGGNPLTFAGLSGMGDLVLTCTGGLSRNRSVGVELGRGRSLDEVLGEMTMVAEGVKTTLAARALGAQSGVEMPIADQVYEVLYEGKPPGAAVRDLMGRRLRHERE